jgi:ABC-2 type transport system permease protein
MVGMRNLVSVVWKEIQLIVRDRGGLGVLFLLPVLMGSLIAGPNVMYARESEQAAILLEVGLVNQDQGPYGVEIVRAVRGIKELSVRLHDSVAEAEESVAQGKATAAIVIPADLSAMIEAYLPVSIEVMVDPVEPESASIVTGIMNHVVDEVAIWGEVQHGIRSILEDSGILREASEGQRRALEAQSLGVIMTTLGEMRRNPLIAVVSEDVAGEVIGGSLLGQYFAYLFPAFAVMFIFFIVGMVSSSLLSERETGVLRRLSAAPISPGTVIAGKMVAYMIIACLQVVVLLTLAKAAFDMPLGKSPVGLAIVTLSVAFAATALGLLVAALAKTPKQADSTGMVLGFVLAGIGGAIPISPSTMFFRSEGLMGFLSQLTPHGHAVKAFYGLMAENATAVEVLPQAAILLGMAALFFLVARWRFRFV